MMKIKQMNRSFLKLAANKYGINPKWYNLKSTIHCNISMAIIGDILTIQDAYNCLKYFRITDCKITSGPIGDLPCITITMLNVRWYQLMTKQKIRSAIKQMKRHFLPGFTIVNLVYKSDKN